MKLRLLILLPLLVCTTACVAGVNGSVDVAAGQPVRDASTVNGSIHIEPNAKIAEGSTVNGSITLGDHATAQSLTTVNGHVTVDNGARVAKGIETVNGALSVAQGAQVTGDATNVNGHISVEGGHIGGGIETVNGDIDITGNAVVDSGLIVRKNESEFNFSNRIPRVVIGPGATVNGTLKFERPVQLYVSNSAHVGQIVGATPVKFSGEQPPAG